MPSRSKNRQPNRVARRRPLIESLETRNLLAGDLAGAASGPPAVRLEGTSLLVEGTPGDDVVTVRESREGLDVRVGRERFGPFANVTRLQIVAGPGDDSIRLASRLDLPTTLSGGPGNDKIWGGAGPDTIDGGDGHDQIFAQAGDDFLFGGPGNDILLGRAGNDVLAGGDGDDVLNGGSETDLLYGEAGADQLRGGAGNDFLLDDDNQDDVQGALRDLIYSNFDPQRDARIAQLREQLQNQVQQGQQAARQADDQIEQAEREIQDARRKIAELREEARQLRDKIRRSDREADQAARREQEARQRAAEHDDKANSGPERDAELAEQYERENQAQINQARKELRDAERLANERSSTFIRLSDRKSALQYQLQNERDPRRREQLQQEIDSLQDQLDALKPQMLEAQERANQARQALHHIDPPGEAGIREKANRQRGVESDRADQARAEADQAADERRQAEKCSEDARQQLRQVEQQHDAQRQRMEDALETKRDAQQAQRGGQRRAQAAAAELRKLEAEEQRRKEREQRQDAQRFAEMHKFFDCDLNVGKSDLGDVTAQDVMRALWLKLQDSNDDLKSAIGFAFGMQFSQTAGWTLINLGFETMVNGLVRTVAKATGFGLLGPIVFVGRKIVEGMKNWDPDCVDSKKYVFDTGAAIGVSRTSYNKKTGEYVTQVDIYFKENGSGPLDKRGKSFRVTLAGKVNLLR